MTEQCGTCRFWLSDLEGSGSRPDEEPAWGWCRREPPRISDHMASMTIARPGFGGHNYDPEDVAGVVHVAEATLFPATWHEKWCGRFEPIGGDA